MNHCMNCGVWVEHLTCPLCHRKVANPTFTTEVKWYPDYHSLKQKKGNSFVSRLVIFVSIVIVSTCLLINIFVTPDFLWVFYVAATVLYLLVTSNHTINSSAHTGAKIFGQVISLSGLLIVVDVLSGFRRWSVNFVVPFLIITATLLITIIILKKRMRWQEYVGFIVALIVLGFLPVGLYITGIATILWPCAITTLYALLTLLGMLLFSDKTFKEELVRRFHI
ncbi:DUF6320 domain-containing protein [Virgibacillus sp. YIM 98842]|uniref:DUF6320 domain-containing protein n=1 Tax=Virgibacillus sp. YIM 98842 TaxID=2663533 RepID=UPI0013DB25D2|nr:DUF6320 domain-containing protein [Virgibacillus sp. YIM 98842]